MKGKVYLVGAGPGDPELLTLKALRILRAADIVLHDELVTQEILELLSPTTSVRNVGKRCGRKKISQAQINDLLVACANRGLTVVRLKGGDPLIFGRAAEEISALQKAGVDFEVIPGVTAALAAAAVARISLTDRQRASKLVFLTGTRYREETTTDWRDTLRSDATVVVYMPGRNYDELASKLRLAGIAGETPCLIVSCAGTHRERIHQTTLRRLGHLARLPAPALVIVGTVVAVDRNPGGEARSDHAWLAAMGVRTS